MGIKDIFRRIANPTDRVAAEALEAKAATVFDHSSLFLSGNSIALGSSSIDNAYSASWIAYSCIRRLANDAAGIPLLFLSDPKDPESSLPEAHPTRQLMERPSPYFSNSELIQALVTFLNMRGEFFIPFDNMIRPTEMYPQLDPLYWRDISTGLKLNGWQYNKSGLAVSRLPDELIHHRLFCPDNQFRGQSPLQAAAPAFGIEIGADKLAQNIVTRGGENAMMFEDTMGATPLQIEQAKASLRARRQGNSTVPSDSILPAGLKPLDPKFMSDDMKILEAGAAQPDKIAAVYGVPKSLLGFGSEEKYANAQIRKKAYYEETLVPMLSGIQDAFDKMFIYNLGPRYTCYVRFDWKSVPAMQDNLTDRFKMAGEAHKAGLPWSVLNQRFELGLPVEEIPGADTIMVASTLAPLDQLIEEWSAPTSLPTKGAAPEPVKSLEGDKKLDRLTDKIIRKRASNTRARIQRELRILKMEKKFRSEWKAVLVPVMEKAAKVAGGLKSESGVSSALKPVFKGLGDKLVKVAAPYHNAAGLEGKRSIIELVDGKMSDAAVNMMLKYEWTDDVQDVINARQNYIKGMDDVIFDDVVASVEESIIAGKDSSEVQHVVRDRFKNAPGGLSRAVTIARTEVGTAYNAARYSEIKTQEFQWHTWETHQDEVVRDNHRIAGESGPVKVGDKFPGIGLPYPQAPGGAAEEVINCRCDTIPSLKGPK